MRLVLFLSVLLLASLACSLTGSDTASNPPVLVVTATSQIVAQPSATPTTQPSLSPTTTNTNNNGTGGNSAPPACVVRSDWGVYTVVAGDTLSSIAQRSNTTTAILLQANCLANANVIRVGQVIRVPSTPLPPTQEPANTLPSITENGVNVRTGPGVAYMSIGTLNRGARVQPRHRTEDGGWYLIVTDGIEGWVSAAYLAGLIPSQVPVYTSPIQPPVNSPLDTIIYDDTSVYSGPGLTYMVVGTLRNGTRIQGRYRSEDGLWVLLVTDGVEGWVWAGSVSSNGNGLPVLPGPYQPPVGSS